MSEEAQGWERFILQGIFRKNKSRKYGLWNKKKTARVFSCGVPTESVPFYVGITQERRMPESKLDLLQGTLDLMVLQTLAAMGALHGYGIARRIEQVSGDEILLNQGTIYASLVRLQQRGWIDAEWGTSDNNRKAKFYSITADGRTQLKEDAKHWQRLSSVMGRLFAMQAEGGKR